MLRKNLKRIFFFLTLMGIAVFTFAEGKKEILIPGDGDMKLVPDKGLLVVGIAEDGPAEKAGIVRGDIIIEADGKAVNTVSDLYGILEGKRAGEILKLTIRHGSDTVEVELKIEDRLFREPLGLALQGNDLRRATGRRGIMEGMEIWKERLHDMDPEFLLRFRGMHPFEDGDFDFQFRGPMFDDDFLENLPEGFNIEELSFSALAVEVFDDSPAKNAGVKNGDIILKVDGKDLFEDYSLRDAVAEFNPGENISLSLLRDSELLELNCRLGENEDGNPYLGIRYRPLFQFHLDRDFSPPGGGFEDRGRRSGI